MPQNRTYVVTGGNAGLGYACSRVLARQPDALVVIACRDPARGEAAAASLRRGGGAVRVLPLDLAAQRSVHDFADAFRAAGLPPLVGLVCNAGVQDHGTPTRTNDGYETTFGVNHLGHYALVRLLLPDLGAGGHIVFVSSNTHDPAQKTGMPAPRYQGAGTLAIDFEPGVTAGQVRYTNSKLCNILCAYELARRLEASGDPRLGSLLVNAFDPGMVPGTGLARSYPAPLRFVWRYVLPALTLFRKNVNRPGTSGRRLAALADGSMGDFTGQYVSMGEVAASSPLSHDEDKARDLWEASAVMTGLPVELGAVRAAVGAAG